MTKRLTIETFTETEEFAADVNIEFNVLREAWSHTYDIEVEPTAERVTIEGVSLSRDQLLYALYLLEK
jgi:hypothetical protein